MNARTEGPKPPEILVRNRQRVRRGVPVQRVERFLHRLWQAFPPRRPGAIVVHLVSDETMKRYQRTYRGLNRTTDVLAFPAGRMPAGLREPVLGDVVISVPQAQRQARRLGHSLGRELCILALHGYLHLLGYDHTRDDGTMMRIQRRLVRALLPRGQR